VGGLECQIQIQNGGRRHFEFSTKRNNSASGSDIVTKFGMMVDMDSPQPGVTLFLTCSNVMSFLGYNKIQDGGRKKRKSQ